MENIARLGLVLDSSRFQQGGTEAVRTLDQIKARAGTTSAAMGVLEQALALVRRAALAAGVALAGMGLAQAGMQAVQLASRYETLGVVLDRVGKSAGYSAGYMRDLELTLRKTGITMTASRQTLVSFIQAQLDLSQASKLARVAQDAAVTANLNSSDTLLRIVRGIQSGETEILRTIGLNVSWDQSYKKLADSLNKTVEQLSQKDKVQARVNAVMEAGIPIAGAYTAAMDTAGKQVQSMKRYVEDLLTQLGNLALPVYTKMVFAFSEAFKAASANFGTTTLLIGALIGRGLTPLVKFLKAATVETYNSVRASLGAAAARVREAQAQEIYLNRVMAVTRAKVTAAAATVALAEAEAVETGSTVRLNAAILALNAASAEAAIVQKALAASQATTAAAIARTTVVARAGAAAMAAWEGVLAFFGGPIGLAVTALAAGLAYLVGHTDAATKASRDHGEALDRERENMALLNTELAKRNRAPAPGSELAKTMELAAKAREELQARVPAVSVSQPQIEQIRQATTAFLELRLSGDKYRETLVQIAAAHPDMAGYIAPMLRYEAAITGVTQAGLDLAKTEREKAEALKATNAQAEASVLVFSRLSDATKKYGERTADAIREQQGWLRGGKAGLEAAQRENKILSEAASLWDETRAKKLADAKAHEDWNKSVLEAANSTDTLVANTAKLILAQARSTNAIEFSTQNMQAAAEAAKSYNARLRELDQTAATARANNDLDAAYEAERQKFEAELAERLRSMDHLSKTQKELLANTEREVFLAEQLRKKAAERAALYDAMNASAPEAWDPNRARSPVPGYFAPGTAAPDLLLGRGGALNRGSSPLTVSLLNDAAQSAERMKEFFKQAARNIQDLFANTFQDIFANGIDGFKSFAQNILRIFQQLAAQILGLMAIKALGIDKLMKQMQSDNFSWKNVGGLTKGLASGAAGLGLGYGIGSMTSNRTVGALGGAAAGAGVGFAVGGPVGAAIGAVGGLIGGIFGSNKKKKQQEEAERQMKKALSDFAEGLRDQTALAGQFRQLDKQFDELAREAKKLKVSTAGAAKAVKDAKDRLAKDFVEGLDAQINAAKGNNVVNQYNEIQKEYADNYKNLKLIGQDVGKADVLRQAQLDQFYQGLSDDEVQRLIKAFPQLQRAVEEARKSIEQGTMTSSESLNYSYATTITEATANRMVGLLTSMDGHLSRIELLVGGGGVAAPSGPADRTAPSISVGEVTIQVTIPAGSDAVEVGTAAGRAAGEEFSRQLATDMTLRNYSSGRPNA